METRNYNIASVEVRADTDTGKRAAGYAAVFDSNSHDLGGFIERIAPGAFARSIREASAGERNIYALWAHDSSMPLGSVRSGKLTLAEDDRGLTFDLATTRFNAAQLDALADNDLQMSFGFSVRDQKWTETETGIIERTLLEVELHEVSFVINPAYPSTDAAIRSMGDWRKEITPIVVVDNLDRLKLVMAVQASLRSR